MTKYLHIASPDKFTIPLCDFILNKCGWDNHQFLFISDDFEESILNKDLVHLMKSRFRHHSLYNTRLFYRLCQNADVIYLHGAPLTFLFAIFPWFTKKLVWVINGAELYNLNKNSQKQIINLNRFTLKRVRKHISHIEGDSVLANQVLGSKADFHYSPMYLSNTVDTMNFNPGLSSEKVKILVGNSNSRNNDHQSIFEKLKKFEDEIEYILCPLSYGQDIEYKETVKLAGNKLFGSKFRVIEDFIDISDYNKLLSGIDIAVFNHWRQEAMGVTLSLLALGKIVYVNSNTTSYKSLKQRGFKIFDNNLLFSEGPAIKRNVSENKSLLEKYYSKDVLIKSILTLEI